MRSLPVDTREVQPRGGGASWCPRSRPIHSAKKKNGLGQTHTHLGYDTAGQSVALGYAWALAGSLSLL